jgi:hypothetical protein
VWDSLFFLAQFYSFFSFSILLSVTFDFNGVKDKEGKRRKVLRMLEKESSASIDINISSVEAIEIFV